MSDFDIKKWDDFNHYIHMGELSKKDTTSKKIKNSWTRVLWWSINTHTPPYFFKSVS